VLTWVSVSLISILLIARKGLDKSIFPDYTSVKWKIIFLRVENMSTHPFRLQEINLFDKERFVEVLGALFEGPPWIVEVAWHARPFSSRAQLYRVLCDVMEQAPGEQQEALLQAHPDLVGRAALAGTLTPESTREQSSAGLNALSPAEIATFQQLNQAYRERFGFPFVICARENKQESILTGFSTRLQHSREQEIRIALAEAAKICALRLNDLIVPTSLDES
jgi:2-oxo-4-hydroxy-4-carboxy-5-ureidoimidazoline decarboxylase